MLDSERVRSVMNGKGKTVTIRGDSSVLEAAQLMRQEGVGCLVVTDVGGGIAGVLSEKDMVARVIAESRNPQSTLVREVLTSKVIAISPESSLSRAREVMAEYGIRHLPVVKNGKLEGMVSSRDILSRQLHFVEQVAQRQSSILREVEKKYPGIGRVEADAAGRIVI